MIFYYYSRQYITFFLLLKFLRAFSSDIKDAGIDKYINFHRKFSIQHTCLKKMKKNREIIKTLDFDRLLNEFLTWNSLEGHMVFFYYFFKIYQYKFLQIFVD